MKENNPQKEKYSKTEALLQIIYFLCYIIIFNITAIILCRFFPAYEEFFSEAAIMLAACKSVIVVHKKTGTALRDSLKIKNFDFITMIVTLIFTWSLCEVTDTLVGLSLSGFITVKENRDVSSNLFSVICAVILAPVFEELIFRYSFRNALRNHYSVGFIILISSFLFALLHFYNIQGFINVFIQALFFMTVYHYTNNLLLTIGTHALHNSMCYIDFDSIKIGGTNIYHTVNGFVIASPAWFAINLAFAVIGTVMFIKYFVSKYIKTK